jgi:hypothetical protein
MGLDKGACTLIATQLLDPAPDLPRQKNRVSGNSLPGVAAVHGPHDRRIRSPILARHAVNQTGGDAGLITEEDGNCVRVRVGYTQARTEGTALAKFVIRVRNDPCPAAVWESEDLANLVGVVAKYDHNFPGTRTERRIDHHLEQGPVADWKKLFRATHAFRGARSQNEGGKETGHYATISFCQ